MVYFVDLTITTPDHLKILQTKKHEGLCLILKKALALSIEVLHDELLFIEENETDAIVQSITKQSIIRQLKAKYNNMHDLKIGPIYTDKYDRICVKGWINDRYVLQL